MKFPSLRGQGMISLDLETRDPDLKTLGPGYLRDGCYIAGVGIGTEAGYREYFPLRHEGGGNLDKNKVLPWVRTQLALPVPKVGANIIYDLGFLAAEGVNVTGPFYDVQIAEPLLDETLRTYSLESLAQRHLKESKSDDEMVQWITDNIKDEKGKPVKANKAKDHIHKVPGHIARPYVIGDVDLPLRIFAKQKVLLERAGLWDLFVLECKLIPMLLAMRQRGVRVDLNRADQLYHEYTRRCDIILGKIKKTSGVDVQIWAANSIAQVFDKLNLSYPRTEKTKAPSFRKEFLAHHKHPVAGLLREVRHLDKLKETFIKSAIMEGAYKGRIHCSFNQLRGDDSGTVSGRFSCVAAWTLIDTPSGKKPIKDLRIGDRVWTHKLRWRTVIATWIKGREQMFDVYLSNGDVLTCTANHRLLDQHGQWQTVGKINELFKEMGKQSQECGSSVSLVPEEGIADCLSDRGSTQHNIPQCVRSFEQRTPPERTQGIEEIALLTRQNRQKESDVRQIRRTPSELDWSIEQRRNRISNDQAERETNPVSSRSHMQSTRDKSITEELPRTPYRRRYAKQQSGQSSSLHEQWTQYYPRLTATWGQAISVTAIEVVGSFEVYDITVAEDESYAACGVFSHNSSQPNLQQVPARGEDSMAIRSIFIPEQGQTWNKFDWSQIEYRLMVNDAAYHGFRGAEDVVNIYKTDSKADFHQIVAEMTGLDRSAAKTVNFGIAYGEGVKKLCRDLGLDENEGQKLLREYHRRAPFMRPLTSYWIDRAESEPFEIRTLLNRRRQFNKWGLERDGEFILFDHHVPGSQRAFTYTALNARIQGSAADLMKKAMVDIWESGVIDILGAPHLTVHDELDFSAPKGKAGKEALKEVKHLMETTVELLVPIVADHKAGKSWGEAE